jgi:hypothetical protein
MDASRVVGPYACVSVVRIPRWLRLHTGVHSITCVCVQDSGRQSRRSIQLLVGEVHDKAVCIERLGVAALDAGKREPPIRGRIRVCHGQTHCRSTSDRGPGLLRGSGAPAVRGETGSSGHVSQELVLCRPGAYRASPEDARVRVRAHAVVGCAARCTGIQGTCSSDEPLAGELAPENRRAYVGKILRR